MLHLIGPVTSAKITKVCKPGNVVDLMYNLFEAKCKSLFKGEKNTIVEHYKFNNRRQQNGETLSDFSIELQSLAENCNFGTFYDTALRERFVAGINDHRIVAKGLSLSSDTKFGKVVQELIKEEMVTRESEPMRIGADQVNKISYQTQRRNFREKSKEKHQAKNFNFRFDRSRSRKEVKCFNCNGTGHISK